MIHIGDQGAAIVPLPDLRRLQTIERFSLAEVVEEADIKATLAVHHEWVTAGQRGAVSHEQAIAELLAEI